MPAVTSSPAFALSPGVTHFPGFGYAGFCRSALEAGGGDLCDVVALSDHSLLLVMADVMGKGVSAALFSASLRTLVRAVAVPDADPGQCLAEVNQLMFDELSNADMFITAQLAVADLASRQLLIGNAGHCPLLVSDGFHSLRAFAPRGMPLGIQRDALFASESVSLEPFSSVLLYTDGITEVRNPAGRMFGQPSLERWFRHASANCQTAGLLRQSLLQELLEFQSGLPASDDQSFLMLSDEMPRPAAMLPGYASKPFLPSCDSWSTEALAVSDWDE